MRTRVLLIVAAMGLLAAACGDDDESSSDATTADTATETTAAADTTEAAGATTTGAATSETTEAAGDTATSEAGSESAPPLEVTSTELGEFLVDSAGRTLYMFVPDDASGTSTCYDACEANWPPIGEVSAGEGVDAALIGTTTREDGSIQATYADWPLYLFSGDSAPGDVNGQGVQDIWFVMAPDGTPIGAPTG